MSHSFSISYVKEMEVLLDANVEILKEKISGFCDRQEAFDLKKLLHYYTIDVLGELAFSQSFGVQMADDETLVPPVKEHNGDPAGQKRKDILTNLILATHPDTGEHLTQTDLETEAFGFIIAGTHTTSATTALLFHHLLHAPAALSKCVAEIDANLPPLLSTAAAAYPAALASSALPYPRACVRENFRITPVFTLPLARRVTAAAEGITIAGRHVPQGVS
ncbi:putative benzoate 4-monooxygenase cytochrome p450 [Diplodia seriata]|uniref:Putative benzoate 4-monooxygenase cytochrome p450 n=1 Tax=Diplodia seriata TaxID=420778 RepID=A0A0G2GSW8_9PEZI|nr:putative benzoate 4-monooxygenase cytochrome p450 [Diplodia seriata]